MIENLPERLKEKRKAKGLTQAEIAEKLKISRTAYAMYESGGNTPPVEVLKEIADIFETSVDYLIGRY